MPYLTRIASLAAVALATGVVVVGVPAASVPAPTPHAVGPRTHAVGLLGPSLVPDAARLSARDESQLAATPAGARRAAGAPRVVPQVQAASTQQAVSSPMVVLGVTWQAGTGADSAVQYRTRTATGWSSWSLLDTDSDHNPDPGTAEGKRARAGSDPLVVTGTKAVQVRVVGPSAHGPVRPQLVMVDPGTSSADAAVGTATPGAAQASTSRPTIYTRAQWGADESLRRAAPEYGAVKAAFVHHTVSANGYSASQVPALIRGIYAYHVNGRGWNDIGYNFLIDRFGRIWEGRYGGVDKPVIGAHTLNYNAYSFGVAAIGNFQTAAVPSAMTSAFERLIAWKAQIHEFRTDRAAEVEGSTFHAISGHRDAFQTECPGQYLYARLPTIRSGATSLIRGLPSLSIARDVDNHNHSDVLATDADHDLLLYSVNGRGAMVGPTYISRGSWSGMDLVTTVGDWTGDGAVDVIARKVSTGQLFLYPGNGTGSFRSAQLIGTGWNGFNALVGPGDWNGDGKPDLLARSRDGQLRLYPGNGAGRFGRARIIGSGWSGMSLLSAMGDWDADGRTDIIGVAATGIARVYRGSGTGGFLGSAVLSGNWSNLASLSAVGDANSDTRTDLLAIRKDGVASIVRVGSTWMTDSWDALPGSWAGASVYTG